MAESKNLTIDLSNVATVEELHSVLQEGLALPDHYGKNFDALHDCLTDILEPTAVTFTGYKHTKKALKADFYTFRNVVEDSAEENPNLHVSWRRRA